MNKKKVRIVLFSVLGALFMGCSELGTRPSKREKLEFVNSSQFNMKLGKFQNRRPGIIKEMKERTMSFKLIKDWFISREDRVPSQKLPDVRPDIDQFLDHTNGMNIIWFGHSSFILNIEGTVILVDPVFSESAAPVSWMVKRFQDPVLTLEELPHIDYIVISHDHYDHLDMKSIKFFKDKSTKFITPLGVGSHLRGWGVKKESIIERDWWESIVLDGIEFIATPAQHFSGRDAFHDNETLWASWVIRSPKYNIYFSGDSGYDKHFAEIGKKYGPFDIAFIENGQYNKLWREVHMLPEEAVQAFKDLKAKKYFPVHWGMFELSIHP